MTHVIAFLLLVLCGVTVHGETNWGYLDQSPEPIIGLLQLPHIVGDGCGALSAPATLNVFASPSQSAARVGTVFMRNEGNAGCDLMIERIAARKKIFLR